ncbi:hypothetical protein GO491_06650 [Flavobacteriaceae bacterium Ap0902]|nr:hypothetical protein [Flavobacteriaceae bacterium Ap0902]
MTPEILSRPEIQQWLNEHAKDDIYNLALKKSPFPDIEMSDLVQQIQGRQIAAKKLPILFSHESICYPPKINLEQTSSATTAHYKAGIIKDGIKNKQIIDITGGFGIDCIYFADCFREVYHIEQNIELQQIAAHNFKVLGKVNIQSHNADGIRFLNEHSDLNDALFVDPARRSANQKKVFLLEDLTPNILEHIEEWNSRFNEVWVKLSPMIDLTYLIKTIPNLSQIHLVAVKNELKEVLIQTKQDPIKKITAVNLETNDFPFEVQWDSPITPPLYSEIKTYIYEPHVAIQKSGYNDVLTKLFILFKLHPNSQLYTSNDLIINFPGRIFKILSPVKNPKKELKGKSIQAIHRNFPESLANLKRKYKFITDGIDPIIFTQTKDKVSILKAEIIT